MKKTTNLFLIIILLLIVFSVFPHHFAKANAPAPPTEIWFDFDLDHNSWSDLTGIQLLGCETESCETPILLQQFGSCTSDKCIQAQGIIDQEGYELLCAENRCYSSVYPDFGGLNFKVLLQINNQVFLSEPIKALPSGYGITQYWKIAIQGNSVTVVEDQSGFGKNLQNNSLYSSGLIFLISIFTEILIATIYFYRIHKDKKKDLDKNVLIVGLVNLITLPMVWFVFPTFGYFHTLENFKLGIIVSILYLIFFVLVLLSFRSKTPHNKTLINLTIISMPISMCMLFGYSFYLNYGNPTIVVNGLSAPLLIAMEEVFAVVVEAILIKTFLLRSISTRQAWVLALVMNAASFLIGQAIQLFVR